MSEWSASIDVMPGKVKYFLKVIGTVNAPDPGFDIYLQRSESPQNKDYPQLDVIYDRKDGAWERVITRTPIEQEIELTKEDLKWVRSDGFKQKTIIIHDTNYGTFEEVLVSIYH